MLATRTAPSIVVQGNVEGSIVAGDHNFVVNTNYGTIINQQAGPRVKLREFAPAAPRYRRDFVGRTRELSTLDQFISQRGAVVVSGLDGLGKTTLVKQIANGTAAHACPNGVVYLEGVDEQGTALDLGDVIQRLFDALFESEPPLKVNRASARTYLSNTQPLVVLDRLALPAAAIHSLPDLFPRGALLVTAESPTGNDLESIKMGPLGRAESVQLFATRARLEVADSNRTTIDSVCALLADVPLAIVTAANVIREKNIPLDQAAHRIADVKPASADSLRAGIERAFAFAFATLAPEERKMLSTVGALPGVSIDRPWLESAKGGQAASAHLERLELLQANSPRLRIPPGLRALAARDVNEQSVREELFAYLRQALTTRSLDFDFVAAELGNLLGLHEWLFGQQRWADVIAFGQAIDPYLTLRGLWNAWRTVLERILHAARATGNARTEGWALHQLGTREIGAGERTRAIALLEQALALRRSIGDVIGAAHTRHNLDVLVPPPPFRPPEAQPPSGPDWGAAAGGFLSGGLAILIVGLIVGLVMANFDAISERSLAYFTELTPSSTPTRMVGPAPSLTRSAPPTSTRTHMPLPDPSMTPTGTSTPTATPTSTGTATFTATWTPTLTRTPITPVGCQGYPHVAFFNASPTVIQQGQGAKLSWGSVTNVDFASIDQGIGWVMTPASIMVSPKQTTMYTLTARCGSNVTIMQATVTVTNPPPPGCQGKPYISFGASPSSILPKDSSTLSWYTSPNVDSVEIDQGVGKVRTSGSLKVWPGKTTTYTLTARCGSNVTTMQATVTVTNPPSGCQGKPYIRFSASPSSIGLKESSTLIWYTSPNADSVEIDQGVGKVSPSGSLKIWPGKTTTYTLTARCGSNVTTMQATVTVSNPPPGCQGKAYIEYFRASPSSIPVRTSSTLSWYASPYADSVEIDQGIGKVSPSGSLRVSPLKDTTYTLTMRCGSNLPVTRQVTVGVYYVFRLLPTPTPTPYLPTLLK